MATKKQRQFNAAGGAFRPLSRRPRESKGQPVSWWAPTDKPVPPREGFTGLAAASVVDQPLTAIATVTMGPAIKYGLIDTGRKGEDVVE